MVICRRSAETSWVSLIPLIAHASIQEVDEDVDRHRASEVTGSEFAQLRGSPVVRVLDEIGEPTHSAEVTAKWHVKQSWLVGGG
jgi:hypothetical protein